MDIYTTEEDQPRKRKIINEDDNSSDYTTIIEDSDDDDKTIPDSVPEDSVQIKEEYKEYHITDLVPVYSKPNKQGIHELIPVEDLIHSVQRKAAAWNITTMHVDPSKRRKTQVESWITDWDHAHKKINTIFKDIDVPKTPYKRLIYQDNPGLNITKKLLQSKLPDQELFALVPHPTTDDMVLYFMLHILYYILIFNSYHCRNQSKVSPSFHYTCLNTSTTSNTFHSKTSNRIYSIYEQETRKCHSTTSTNSKLY